MAEVWPARTFRQRPEFAKAKRALGRRVSILQRHILSAEYDVGEMNSDSCPNAPFQICHQHKLTGKVAATS